MEIINKKEIKLFVKIVIVVSLVTIIIPLFAYIYNFKDIEISSSSSDWGTFGDYIGGIVGTFFSLIAALFSLASIYITLRIAIRLQKYEDKKNSENIIRENERNDKEKERFEKEIELAVKQNIPLPFLHMTKSPNKTEIILCNYGIGPLLLKEWYLEYDGTTYTNFDILLSAKVKTTINYNEVEFLNNTSPEHVLSPEGTRVLFSIKSKLPFSKDFMDFQYDCRDIFQDTKIHFVYEDIFENRKDYLRNLRFLKN